MNVSCFFFFCYSILDSISVLRPASGSLGYDEYVQVINSFALSAKEVEIQLRQVLFCGAQGRNPSLPVVADTAADLVAVVSATLQRPFLFFCDFPPHHPSSCSSCSSCSCSCYCSASSSCSSSSCSSSSSPFFLLLVLLVLLVLVLLLLLLLLLLLPFFPTPLFLVFLTFTLDLVYFVVVRIVKHLLFSSTSFLSFFIFSHPPFCPLHPPPPFFLLTPHVLNLFNTLPHLFDIMK